MLFGEALGHRLAAPEADRYEARVGDELAGFAQYRERPGLIAFVHTEVDDRFDLE